jgi:uncharacterized membrane protein
MRKSITVNRPVEEVYAFWRNFENFPRIMPFLDTVQAHNGRSHWSASAPADMNFEWDTEITEDIPNQRIAWESVEGSDFQNSGSVSFKPASANRGTEVTLTLDFDRVADAATKLMGAAPELIAYKALYDFKSLLVTGEIPTTQNQPAARDGGRSE